MPLSSWPRAAHGRWHAAARSMPMREVYRGLGRDVDTGRSACLTYLTSKMPEFQKALHEARRAAQPDPARRDDGDGSSGRGGRRARACVVRITSRSRHLVDSATLTGAKPIVAHMLSEIGVRV